MKNKVFFLLIIILAIFFRFNNLNWDSGFHLHPDERFLTMVGNAMTMPLSLKDYLDPAVSTFNPANIGYKFYVYGVFPVVLNKIVALASGNDNYSAFTIQGRLLSAFFDILTLILVYKITELIIYRATKTDLNPLRQSFSEASRFEPISTVPLWSAFFYAIAVFPIQLSHFFAVDTFLVFFMISSFYFVLKTTHEKISYSIFNIPYFLSAIFFGLALACKISAIYIAPLNLLILFLAIFNDKKNLIKVFFSCLLITSYYLLITYFTLRFANPYYFESANLLNPWPNKIFIDNIKQLTVLSSGEISYPPAVQWYGKGPLFLLINTVVFGLGIPYFIFTILGIVKIIISNFKSLISKKLLITILWVIGLFFYQSIQFVRSMRYTIYLYPFFAILAALGFNWIVNGISVFLRNQKSKIKNQNYNSKFKIINVTCYVLCVMLIMSFLIWPLMFSSIYMNKHSRVAASEWIYQNLKSGSLILSEHWDDGLPLPMAENFGKQFTVTELPVFDPDTPEKWQKMDELLARGDYYILSSNRAWGSVPNMPEKYPKMIKFYNDLFTNKTSYKLIKEFTSYPSLCYVLRATCYVAIDDQWSEELFTVYDHPKVLIFKNKSK